MLPGRVRIATALLSCLLPAEDVETIVGDLEEEYASRSRSAWARAGLWYWMQAVRSLPILLWLPVRRGGLVSTAAVGLAACAVQAGVEVATGFALTTVAPAHASWPAGVALVVTLLSLTVVSYQSTQMRPGAATLIALVAGLAISLRWLLSSPGRGVPIGMQFVLLLFVPSMALMGGALATRFRSHTGLAAGRDRRRDPS